jgi:hypothetical protein
MVNSAHTQANREKIIATQQTSERRPFDLRRELNSEYTVKMMVARGVAKSRNPKDIAMRKRAEAQMADLAEQLNILDAIEFIQEIDVEKLHKAIVMFEAETDILREQQ